MKKVFLIASFVCMIALASCNCNSNVNDLNESDSTAVLVEPIDTVESYVDSLVIVSDTIESDSICNDSLN